jgi:hypothetical protein
MTLQAGFAWCSITPSLESPVYLAGFGQNRRAQSIHDDLSVRAVSLSDGATTLVLCALDLIGYFRSHVQQVIQRVHSRYPDVQVLIASTHTHHGPDTMGLWGPNTSTSGVDGVYMVELSDRITKTICEAIEGMQPAAGIKGTSVTVPGLVKNARNPEILDEELSVLQILPETGPPLVTLLDFPCHPEVLWEHNPYITADYPGYLRKAVEDSTHAPAIFFSGALGGMLTPDVKDHSFEEAEAMGARLAEAALNALYESPLQAEPTIRFERAEVPIRLNNLLFKIAIWRRLMPDVRTRGQVLSEVSLIRLESMWLAAVPGELLPRLGLAIKKRLLASGAAHAAIIGLANDELGYLLPTEDFHYPLNPFSPGKHYEETMSLSKEAGNKVVEAVEKLLEIPGDG